MRSFHWLETAALLFLGTTAADAWGAAALERYSYPQSLGRDRVVLMWRTTTPALQTVDYESDGSFRQSVADAAPTRTHELTLGGLQPGTQYTYRIREGAEVVLANPSKYWFRTDAGRSDTQFSFFVTGDIGVETSDRYQQITQAMVRRISPRAEFGLLTGDIMLPDGRSERYDAQLMSPWRDLLANTCMWPCLGNHDYMVNPDSNYAREWALPHNEHYYSFDYGDAHFVALDTGPGYFYDEANQLAWLQADLEAARGRYMWTFVFYHHPLLTCTYKSNMPVLAAKLMPILDQYRVDVVFNGHAHTYERLYPIYGRVPVDQAQDPSYTDTQGTIYIVSGCGGKTMTGSPTTFCGPTAAFVNERILFTQAFVEGHTLYIVTFDSTTGEVVDFVCLTKNAFPTDIVVAPPGRGLRQNMPNPFNPTTSIPFELPAAASVRLRVFRLDGTWVADLADGVFPAGAHRLAWDGRDRTGARVPSGAYLCRLDAGRQSWSIKMTLIR